MNASQWLEVMLLGIVSGAAGQLARSIAGIVKLNQSRIDPDRPTETFQINTLVMSIIIGATAGLIAALAMFGDASADPEKSKITTQSILGLMAAGYAGADFIQAFAGKYLGGSAPAPSAVNADELKKQVQEMLAGQKNTDGSLG